MESYHGLFPSKTLPVTLASRLQLFIGCVNCPPRRLSENNVHTYTIDQLERKGGEIYKREYEHPRFPFKHLKSSAYEIVFRRIRLEP